MSIFGVHQKIFKEMEDKLTCVLSADIMVNPVRIKCSAGHSFEKAWIEQHFQTSNKCPLCREEITEKTLTVNRDLMDFLESYRRLKLERSSSLQERVEPI